MFKRLEKKQKPISWQERFDGYGWFLSWSSRQHLQRSDGQKLLDRIDTDGDGQITPEKWNAAARICVLRDNLEVDFLTS